MLSRALLAGYKPEVKNSFLLGLRVFLAREYRMSPIGRVRRRTPDPFFAAMKAPPLSSLRSLGRKSQRCPAENFREPIDFDPQNRIYSGKSEAGLSAVELQCPTTRHAGRPAAGAAPSRGRGTPGTTAPPPTSAARRASFSASFWPHPRRSTAITTADDFPAQNSANTANATKVNVLVDPGQPVSSSDPVKFA